MSVPRFSAGITVLSPDQLRYNPRGDIIFPSVVRTEGITDARGRFYLYYAPHDAPGGICLAYADQLTGPWTEHGNNPVIARSWPPHYEVEHVSSPHALWRDDLGELWLYYHGDNETTRWARSKDGVRFTYGGVAIDAASFGMDGASYARVFADPFSQHRYLMVLLMYRHEPGSWDRYERSGIYGAHSDDGERWAIVERPILEGSEEAFVCSPFLHSIEGGVYLLYHQDEDLGTNVCRVAIDDRLRPIGEPELVCDRSTFGSGNDRISDPFLIDGVLFGAIGPRLRQRIGAAFSA